MEFMVYNLVFIMKMTVYTIWLVWLKGRASAISFYGWGFEWTSWIWIWNTRFVMNHSWWLYSRNQNSPNPIIYVDIWIYNFTYPWILLQFTNIWSAWHSPRFRALPPTTCHNHNTEQPLLLSLKPRLILYSNEFCHTSRADTICAVSL